VAVLLGSCAGDAPERDQPQAVTEGVTPSRDTYALGTQLTPAGAVSATAAGEQFTRGGEVFLSITVAGASGEQRIGVEWVDPRGKVIRKDTRTVPRDAQYAPFSTGNTARWKPGPHRAIVIINGRRVTEREFGLM
jgi:hypothetical protein